MLFIYSNFFSFSFFIYSVIAFILGRSRIVFLVTNPIHSILSLIGVFFLGTCLLFFIMVFILECFHSIIFIYYENILFFFIYSFNLIHFVFFSTNSFLSHSFLISHSFLSHSFLLINCRQKNIGFL